MSSENVSAEQLRLFIEIDGGIKASNIAQCFNAGVDVFVAGSAVFSPKDRAKAIADLKAGKPIYVGPIKSNTGKLVIDKTYGNYDPFLDQTNFLVEGVVGSIS